MLGTLIGLVIIAFYRPLDMNIFILCCILILLDWKDVTVTVKK
jgi:hypothetical protein